MAPKTPSLRLVLEIHCAIDTPAEKVGHASIWISPADQYIGPPCDTLEQEGMVRVYGPAPMKEAEAFQEKLAAVLSRAGCAIVYETAADD
jgi:hypothetical protein